VKSPFAVSVLLALSILGTGHPAPAQDKGEPLPCDYKQVGLDAAKFYIYLTQDTPYRSWSLWPGREKLSQGKAPHGRYVTTYVNPAALRSIESGAGMAFGSLIVTENYDDDKKLAGLMVKLKIKGYNPAEGDWYWFQYDRQGTAVAEGRVDGCINCHRARRGNENRMTAPAK
jgi:hypothetical protein